MKRVLKNKVLRLLGILSLCLGLILLTLLAGCASQKAPAPREEVAGEETSGDISSLCITDMAGRSLTVPDEINKVFSVSPVGTVLLYTLAPEKLAGWNYELQPGEKQFILPEYHDLPNLGGWYGKTTGNVEEFLKVKPDLIVSMGTLEETDLSFADQLQEQLGIPVVLISGEITELDEAYIFTGELLGVEEKAGELAQYCRETLEEITAKAQQIPADRRLRVYYAEGPEGLETDPQGSVHTQVLDLVGGINVAAVEIGGGGGRSSVSLEQILLWDPDLIIAWSTARGGCYEAILNHSDWQGLQAVKNKMVFDIPNEPFNWFDRPYSVNRILGLKWLGNLLYPEVFTYDLEKEVKEFYAKFYHHELSPVEVKKMLANCTRK